MSLILELEMRKKLSIKDGGGLLLRIGSLICYDVSFLVSGVSYYFYR